MSYYFTSNNASALSTIQKFHINTETDNAQEGERSEVFKAIALNKSSALTHLTSYILGFSSAIGIAKVTQLSNYLPGSMDLAEFAVSLIYTSGFSFKDCPTSGDT